MCECYQIGGRFISEDPECPTHGTEAQAEEVRREKADLSIHGQIEALDARVLALEEALEAAGIRIPIA